MRKSPKLQFDEAKIDAIFAPYDQSHAPGAAVGITIGGKPVYRKGFGLASLELPVTLSPTIRMRIGSTTKHFTALAYMLQVEKNRASLDDPIGKHLPELSGNTAAATVRHLLQHVSGLRDTFDLNLQFGDGGKFVDHDAQFDVDRKLKSVNFEPGESWSYNNGAYALVSRAIERLTGKSLEEVFKDDIFTPVGMHDSLLRRSDTDMIPNSASLHRLDANGVYQRGAFKTSVAGEGGIVSTVDDMLRWMAHMDDPVVGTAASWAEIRKCAVLNNGFVTDYGLGLMTETYRGVTTLSHAGGVIGGNSEMIKVPELGLDIVVMVNRSDAFGMMLAQQIIDACISGLADVPTPASEPLVSGLFCEPETGAFVGLSHRDGQQFITLDTIELPAKRTKSGAIKSAMPGFYGEVVIADENAAELEYQVFGTTRTLMRIDGTEGNGPVAGNFSADCGFDALVSNAEDAFALTFTGAAGSTEYGLEHLAGSLWRAKAINAVLPVIGGIVEFSPDGSFRLSTTRTARLAFDRIAPADAG